MQPYGTGAPRTLLALCATALAGVTSGGAASGCASDPVDTAPTAADTEDTAPAGVSSDDFSLNLTPVIASNQDPFAGADRLDLVLQTAGAEEAVYSAELTEAGATLPEIPPLEGTSIRVEVYAGDALAAYGSTEALTVVSGTVDVRVLIGQVDAFAALDSLADDGLFRGAAAPTGRGGFLLFGGSARAPSQYQISAEDEILLLKVTPPDETLTLVEVAELPTYVATDPETGEDATFSGRAGHTATLLTGAGDGEGLILVAGGGYGYMWTSAMTDHAFLYDPVALEVVEQFELRDPRWGHHAVLNNSGDVVLLGGLEVSSSGSGGYSIDGRDVIEIFTRSTGDVEELEDRLVDVEYPLFGVVADLDTQGVLYCGGFNLNTSSLWIAEVGCTRISTSGTVEAAEPLPHPVVHGAMAPLPNGRAVLAGGIPALEYLDQSDEVKAVDWIWIYDADSDTWAASTVQLSTPRARHVMTPLPDGRVLIAGGAVTASLFGWDAVEGLDCAEIYDPVTDSVTPLTDCDGGDPADTLPGYAMSPTVAVDEDGAVLVVGGFHDGDPARTGALFFGQPEASR